MKRALSLSLLLLVAHAAAAPRQGRIAVGVGPSVDLTARANTQLVLGLEGAISVTPSRRGFAVFSPQLQLLGGVVDVRLPVGFEYEFPVGPRGLSLFARFSVGYAARIAQTVNATATNHAALLQPEAGLRYLMRSCVFFALTAVAFPIEIFSDGARYEYRPFAQLGLDLPLTCRQDGRTPVPHTNEDDLDPVVDIDVDTNRNGKVDDVADEPHEADPIKFLDDHGALVLVNCDDDGKQGPTKRDMDDDEINAGNDADDMSPVSLELKRDLQEGEELWLVANPVDDKQVWINFFDPVKAKPDQILVGYGHPEERIDNLIVDAGVTPKEVLFPGGRKHRYDKRFLVEGLRFAKEVKLRLEIRRKKEIVASDEARMMNTPWLANNNTQPLFAPANQPTNLINSNSFQWAAAHGSVIGQYGAGGEFVQDSAEWGFQVRRMNPPAGSRMLLTALRLHPSAEDEHPRNSFLGPDVAVYGYWPDDNGGLDEVYFTNGDGDAGGNLECLPPTDKQPYGQLVYGDTISATLTKFLDRQVVQVPALVMPITAVHLVHVDESMVVVPLAGGVWLVAMPDWDLARKLMAGQRPIEHNIDVQPGTQVLTTYGAILTYLDKDKNGIALNKTMDDGLKALQQTMTAAGATVLPLPAMFLVASSGNMVANKPVAQRSFPRGIANSQPTVPGTLVVSEPPQEDVKKGKKRESSFLTEWTKLLKAKGVTVEIEQLVRAWASGGEAHCTSNAIRAPYAK